MRKYGFIRNNPKRENNPKSEVEYMHKHKVLALIPARAGSKSVPNKNIRLLNGKPLMAYSIEHALQCPLIDRVIVSTDSEKYADIAREYGAEVPFIRPSEYAQDDSPDIDVFLHALNYLNHKENYVPDIIVQLRPTYPIRNLEDIVKMIVMLDEDDEADSVRCIAPAKEIAYKMWRKSGNGEIRPILQDIAEAYNMPRQRLPAIFYQNACIDVMRYNTIVKKHSMSGDKILGYEMQHNFDIDTEDEFNRAALYLTLLDGNRKLVFDIDGVVAKLEPNLKYECSEPNEDVITVINRLYEMGNYIVLFTARGYKTGMDWSEITRQQLRKWGVKYHELKFGKPDADLYIDDKGISIQDFSQIFM